MRAHRGFTLIEMVVTLTIMAVVAGIVFWQGRSARQAGEIARGAYDLALRVQGMRARAMAEAKDYVLVVVDASDPARCVSADVDCGRVVILRDPVVGFSITGFSPDPPVAGAEWVDDDRLPRNTQFDLTSTWRPPAPFAAVQAFDPAIRATCAGGRACFGIRFRSNGEVTAEWPAAAVSRAGFAFVLRPVDAATAAIERRALFVSFPSGIVKTAAF